MHACYLLYTAGPVVQAITSQDNDIAAVAMCLAASKGFLNVLAVNEGRISRIILAMYLTDLIYNTMTEMTFLYTKK